MTRWQSLVKKHGGVMQALPHYKKGKKASRKRSSGKRRVSRRSRRSVRRNPGIGAVASRPIGMLTSKTVWMDVALVGAGVFANYQLRKFITPKVLSAGNAAGPMSYLVGVGAALASGFVPKVGPKLMVGGLLMETVRALNQYVIPAQYKMAMGDYLDTDSQMGDYLDTDTRMGDYMQDTTDQTSMIERGQKLASYLTTGETGEMGKYDDLTLNELSEEDVAGTFE